MSSITDFSKQANVLAEKEEKQLIADHRYDVIYPILRPSVSVSKRELFKELSKMVYVNPITGCSVMYSESTIKRWYYTYVNNSNQRSSLITKSRSDIGKPRVLTPELCEAILKMKEEYKFTSATNIYNTLVVNGEFNASLRTITDFIAKQKLNLKKKDDKQRLPFEKQFANMTVYGDTNFGPFIKINGQSVRTYLISFVDDATRVIVGARYYLADNSVNVQATLKEAVMRWGIADIYKFDQGSPYKNKQLARIIRGMGSNVKHAMPYEPTAKAFVERSFLTKDTMWLNNVDHSSFNSLEHLNEELDIYVNNYNFHHIHSELGCTPIERWMKDKDRIVYLDENNIDAYFLHYEDRVVKNDTTIQVDKVKYQLPAFATKYIKQKIRLFYVPDVDEKNIEYMVNDGKKYVKIQPVNKLANGSRFATSTGEIEDTLPVDIPKLPSFKKTSNVNKQQLDAENKLAIETTKIIEDSKLKVTLSYKLGGDN